MNMVDSLDVCPTEDAIEVFLQYLVDPLLPEKSSVRDNPTRSQQESMAKQVYSAVLLYNYYHRKQHPELEYLPFNEFCKLIVVLRPPLLAYMQFMQKFNEVELIDVEKQLSLTEKGIMDACDACKCLDPSKNAPNTEGWPISKISILLIDGKKENCFLLFSSITEGVWSVVEKSIDASSINSEVTPEMSNTCKRKRVIKKPKKDESKVDEYGLLQIGYSAVKEATGINNTDIMLLESYTVYSQSKEKAASRFFIMQCSQSINQDIIKVPLKDVIESLQGPLVKKGSSSWTITPAVAYFHVFPYSEIISQCISRKESLEQKVNNGSCVPSPCNFIKEAHEMDVNRSSIYPSQNRENQQNITKTILVSEDQEKNNAFEQCNSNGSASAIQVGAPSPCNFINETHEVDVNRSSIYPSQNREKRQNITKTIQVSEDLVKNNASEQCNSNDSASAIQAMKVDSTNMLINGGGTNNIVSCGKLCTNSPNTLYEKETTDSCTQSSSHSNSDTEKLRSVQDSKKTLSRTAISSLIRKRNELALQQRKIEDEIASCDEKIQRILTDGKDDFGSMIECIIEGCNDVSVTNQEGMGGQQSFPRKKRDLSEPQSSCQDLDGVM